MKKTDKILIAGSNGMVGSAIVRSLKSAGYDNLVYGSREWVDFTKSYETKRFFINTVPDYIFLTAARCGGIFDNINYPVNYLLDNLKIQNNIIESAYEFDVKKLMFFASSCIFPKHANQPIKEEYLLTGSLEPTNEPYSIAKIAGIKLCEAYNKQYETNFISVNPCNIYGVGDKFDPMRGHVMSSLIYKIWKAKKDGRRVVECFGDGSPMREFMYVDDLADACIHVMNNYKSKELINIGTGVDITIRELAQTICEVIDYRGDLVWDISKPNGMMRKVLDIQKLESLGWQPKINLKAGIQKVVNYLDGEYVED